MATPTTFWQEDYTVFLMRLAFETRLAHWITVRASTGYEHMDNRGDLPNPATGEHIPLGLGVGLHVGTLALDLALTDREPQGLSRYSATLPADRKCDLAFHHPELRVLMDLEFRRKLCYFPGQ